MKKVGHRERLVQHSKTIQNGPSCWNRRRCLSAEFGGDLNDVAAGSGDGAAAAIPTDTVGAVGAAAAWAADAD